MAVTNIKLGGVEDFTSGIHTDFTDDLNDTYNRIANRITVIGSISMTTDLDSADGTYTAQLASTDIDNATYILAHISYAASGSATGISNSRGINLRIERNETGQSSWSDVFASSTLVSVVSNPDGSWDRDSSVATVSIPITLTSDEKTNGLDVKFSTTWSGSGGTATFANRGIYFTALQ